MSTPPPGYRTWAIDVSGVRAEPPRLRVSKAYRVTAVRFDSAAGVARHLAAMAGLEQVLIVGVRLEWPQRERTS